MYINTNTGYSSRKIRSYSTCTPCDDHDDDDDAMAKRKLFPSKEYIVHLHQFLENLQDIWNFRLIIRRHYTTIIVSARYDDVDDDPKPSSTTILLAMIHDKHQHPQNTANRVIYYKNNKIILLLTINVDELLWFIVIFLALGK